MQQCGTEDSLCVLKLQTAQQCIQQVPKSSIMTFHVQLISESCNLILTHSDSCFSNVAIQATYKDHRTTTPMHVSHASSDICHFCISKDLLKQNLQKENSTKEFSQRDFLKQIFTKGFSQRLHKEIWLCLPCERAHSSTSERCMAGMVAKRRGQLW